MAWHPAKLMLVPLALIIALVAAATSASVRARTVRILMEGAVLRPAVANAEAGDTVEWTNADPVAHTATARNGDFDVFVPAGAVVSLVLSKAGRFDYYSRPHPIMEGTLEVAPRRR